MGESDLGFEFFLAAELHMTVGEMRRRMTNAEYQQWCMYYQVKAQKIEAEQQKRR